MKYVFASRTGNVQSLIDKLGVEAEQIVDGSEKVDGDYVLFTYTDGAGDVPYEVEEFLKGNADHLKGVVASGNKAHGDNFAKAGDKIAEEYGVKLLYKVEDDGSDADVAEIKKVIA